MSPAERADVIVYFTGYQGVRLFLINEGPDEPFGGGTPGVDFPFADPATTGQVLKFVVDLPLSQPDTSVDPASLYLPSPPRLGVPSVHRRVALLEEVGNGGPRAALLGKAEGQGPTAMPEARLWSDPITESPRVGATEIWEMGLHDRQAAASIRLRARAMPANQPWTSALLRGSSDRFPVLSSA